MWALSKQVHVHSFPSHNVNPQAGNSQPKLSITHANSSTWSNQFTWLKGLEANPMIIRCSRTADRSSYLNPDSCRVLAMRWKNVLMTYTTKKEKICTRTSLILTTNKTVLSYQTTVVTTMMTKAKSKTMTEKNTWTRRHMTLTTLMTLSSILPTTCTRTMMMIMKFSIRKIRMKLLMSKRI